MVALLIPLLSIALAHGLDAQQLQLELEGAALRVSLTPGVALFGAADTNADGALDRAEVAAARADIRARVADGLSMVDPDGVAAVCDDVSVSTIGNGAPHVRVTLRCALPSAPEGLTLRARDLGDAPYRVEAVRLRRVDDARWEAVDGSVRAELPGNGQVTLFGAPPPSAHAAAVPWLARGAASLLFLAAARLALRLRARPGPPTEPGVPA